MQPIDVVWASLGGQVVVTLPYRSRDRMFDSRMGQTLS